MKITDLNPLGGIGAHCQLVEIGPFSILIDCGLNPKMVGNQATPALTQLEGKQLDLVLLTHCHLDHLGSLPVLLRQQIATQVWMSPASEFLYQRMLKNSFNVMRRQREEQYIADYPLFTKEEVERSINQVKKLEIGQKRSLEKDGEQIEVSFYHAGHVVGAVGVELKYKHRRIFFTGDVLFQSQRTLKGADFPAGPFDTVVMETTRGATPTPESFSREEVVEELIQTVGNTLRGNGSVLIPVFALGRMQEILSILHFALKKKLIPRVPIYSSGLGLDLAEFIDQISKRLGGVKFSKKILHDLNIRRLPKLKPGKHFQGQGLFVCSSGMVVENTPSYRVAASILPYNENTICFVGYCDPDTPGGRIQQTKPGEDYLFDAYEQVMPLRCRVRRFDLSGHAAREELLEYVLSTDPRSVVLSHGDAEARSWFNDQLLQMRPSMQVVDPQPLSTTLV